MRKLLPNVFKPLSNTSGQGVIEYILVLIVTVAIILGVIYQFNDAFRVYAKSYFGDYLACLLETGELPSIGGEGNGMCNAFFQPFSLASGRPYATGNTGDGGGGSGNNNNETAAPTKAGESKASGNTPYVASNSSGGGSQFRSRSSSGAGSSSSSSSKNRNNYTGSSDASIPPSALGSKASGSGSQNQYLEGDFYVERRTVEESEEANKIAIKTSSSTVQQVQRMRVNRQEASVKQEEADVGFTVGNFLRILLIIAIIVALVVFLGGQALQISKSMD